MLVSVFVREVDRVVSGRESDAIADRLLAYVPPSERKRQPQLGGVELAPAEDLNKDSEISGVRIHPKTGSITCTTAVQASCSAAGGEGSASSPPAAEQLA
jgi:hypothetical protein